MSEQAQPISGGRRRQLDEVILSLQRLRDAEGEGEGEAEGLSTQSNGCSTYSVHCHGVQVEAVRR
jgi:hypothetical protein